MLESEGKETPRQVFPCEYCDVFKNTSFYRTPPMAASLHNNCSEKFRKIQRNWPAALLKKELRGKCFPVNLAKLLRNTSAYLQNTSGEMLLGNQ